MICNFWKDYVGEGREICRKVMSETNCMGDIKVCWTRQYKDKKDYRIQQSRDRIFSILDCEGLLNKDKII